MNRVKPYVVLLAVSVVASGFSAMGRSADQNGLVAHWKFDEPSGSIAKNSVGAGLDGTVSGATWVKGIDGGALSFNGTDSCKVVVQPANLPKLSSFTIEAWVKLKGYAPTHAVVSWWDHILMRADAIGQTKNAFDVYAFIDGNPEPRAWGASAEYGKWCHVAGVWDGRYLQVYVNGEGGAKVTHAGALGVSDTPLEIGPSMNGLIDDVKLYQRALSAKEIKADYEKVRSAAGLVVTKPKMPAPPKPLTATESAQLEQKINKIISQMTLEEKQAMCHGNGSMDGGGCPRLGIGPIRMSDGPLGVSRSGPVTGFGSGMLLAQTWNPSLLRGAGIVLGREANAGNVDCVLGPGINIIRDLVGGRDFEYYTEDPYLNGVMAANMVQGIQSQGVAATVKHFIANNQENNREGTNSIVDDRTLREIYLPGYENAIKQGGAWAVMASCGLLNGVECYGTPLLRNVLKNEYGFKGLTMTDWGSVSEGGTITGTTEQTAINGMDLSMPNASSYKKLALLVKSGKLPISVLDDMVRRVLRVAYKAGVVGWGPNSHPGQINTDANHSVARKVAEEGIVLLKNNRALLPLSKSAGQSIILTGYNADARHCPGGGSSAVNVPYEITPKDALEGMSGLKVNYQPTLDGAVEAAKKGGTVVVVTGYRHAPPYQGGDTEGSDKFDLTFPEQETKLINAVAAVNPNVIVVFVGGPLEIRDWVDHVPAVVYEAYPGMEHGHALTSILFGDVNPSGKLTITWPKRDSDQPSFATRNPSKLKYTEGIFVGYRGYDKKKIVPEFAFGHGLSYTQFKYSNIKVTAVNNHNQSPKVTVSFKVSNTGKRAGKEVAQVYVHPINPSVPRPVKELKGFTKVMLQPGETKAVSLTLDQRSFAYWSDLSDWYAEPGSYQIMVGSASDDIRLTGSVKLQPTPGAKPRPKQKAINAVTVQPVIEVKRYEGTPYGGKKWVIPGVIEAENYDDGGEGMAYHDSTAGNAGGVYRHDGVDIQECSEGGYNVCCVVADEWLKYSVSIPQPGLYTMEMRVSRGAEGYSFCHLDVDGNDVTGNIVVRSTGGWQNWTTVKKTGVYLNTINQVMKLVCDGSDFNVDWIKFTPEGSTAK